MGWGTFNMESIPFDGNLILPNSIKIGFAYFW